MEWYLEILGNIKNTSDIKRVVVIKLVESGLEIFWTNLPDTHEDKLMIWMASKKHRKELVGILRPDIIPMRILEKMR